jgi:hypothetical protein
MGNKFYIHVLFGESMGETVIPIIASNLDAAHDWADANYGQNGIEVTRVRQAVIQPTQE